MRWAGGLFVAALLLGGLLLADDDASQYFPRDYDQSRAAFRHACVNTPGCVADSFAVTYSAPAGQDLSINTALIAGGEGSSDSPRNQRLLILQSGIHGPEAFAGAAVQRLVFEKHLPRLCQAGIDVLMIHAVNAWPSGGLGGEGRPVELTVRFMRDDRVRHAALTDERRKRPCVEAVKPNDAAGLQPGVEPPGRPKIRGVGHIGAHDHAARARRGRQIDRFDIFLIRADIADMRKGERDYLASIGRIGQNFLIARHRCIETDLADRRARCAKAKSLQYHAIGHDQQRRRLTRGPAVRLRLALNQGHARSRVIEKQFGLCLCAGRALRQVSPPAPPDATTIKAFKRCARS